MVCEISPKVSEHRSCSANRRECGNEQWCHIGTSPYSSLCCAGGLWICDLVFSEKLVNKREYHLPELFDFCSTWLALFKMLDKFVFVDDILFRMIDSLHESDEYFSNNNSKSIFSFWRFNQGGSLVKVLSIRCIKILSVTSIIVTNNLSKHSATFYTYSFRKV